MVCVRCDVGVRQRPIVGLAIRSSWLWHSRCTLGISCFILWFPNTKHEHMSLGALSSLSLSLIPQLLPRFQIYLLVLHLPVALSTFPFLLPLTRCLAHTGDNSNSKHCRVKTNPFCRSENKPLSPFSLSPSLPLFLSLSFSSPLFSHRENKLLSLYLFYIGRPDHHRDSSGPFQP